MTGDNNERLIDGLGDSKLTQLEQMNKIMQFEKLNNWYFSKASTAAPNHNSAMVSSLCLASVS